MHYCCSILRKARSRNPFWGIQRNLVKTLKESLITITTSWMGCSCVQPKNQKAKVSKRSSSPKSTQNWNWMAENLFLIETVFCCSISCSTFLWIIYSITLLKELNIFSFRESLLNVHTLIKLMFVSFKIYVYDVTWNHTQN